MFPREKFFDFKNTLGRRPFLVGGFFYCDGRMVVDGGGGWWMVDSRQKGSSILLKLLSDEVQVI